MLEHEPSIMLKHCSSMMRSQCAELMHVRNGRTNEELLTSSIDLTFVNARELAAK